MQTLFESPALFEIYAYDPQTATLLIRSRDYQHKPHQNTDLLFFGIQSMEISAVYGGIAVILLKQTSEFCVYELRTRDQQHYHITAASFQIDQNYYDKFQLYVGY